MNAWLLVIIIVMNIFASTISFHDNNIHCSTNQKKNATKVLSHFQLELNVYLIRSTLLFIYISLTMRKILRPRICCFLKFSHSSYSLIQQKSFSLFLFFDKMHSSVSLTRKMCFYCNLCDWIYCVWLGFCTFHFLDDVKCKGYDVNWLSLSFLCIGCN